MFAKGAVGTEVWGKVKWSNGLQPLCNNLVGKLEPETVQVCFGFLFQRILMFV